MLTIRKIKVAKGDVEGAKRAAGYPLERADSPGAFAHSHYYTESEGLVGEGGVEPTAMWLGSEGALAQLGVGKGQDVTEEDLAMALQGMSVDGKRRVRKLGNIEVDVWEDGGKTRDGKQRIVKEKQPGTVSIDLTFSAPKSVSVVWAMASPELRARIEQAMLTAANAAISHMTQTKDVMYDHKDENGKAVYRPGYGYAAAATLHVTARRAEGEAVPSPQLHVHGVVVGLERADGTLAGIETSAMYGDDAMLEGGAVGRAVLANELTALGFDIESDTGNNGRFFEIRGVPPGLIEAMSGRTRDVEREARRIERATGKRLNNRERAAIAALTRLPKGGDYTPEETMKAWDALAQEFEFGAGAIGRLLRAPGYVAEIEDRHASAWTAIEAKLRAQGPTISRGAAVAAVVESAAGRMGLDQAFELLEEMEQTGALIGLHSERVTSRQIRETEQRVMAVARGTAGQATGPLSQSARDHGMAVADASLAKHGGSLDPEQRDAIAELTEGRGWTTLTGRAGTGKGPVLEAVAAAHRADGWQVLACAVDWTTANRLGRQMGSPAESVQMLLHRARTGDLTIDANTFIVIDEASKVGLGLWSQLADLVERHGARVLAVGHEGQLGAIELPGLFAEMIKDQAIRAARLQVIRRHLDPLDNTQPHPWLGDYQVAIDSGDPTGAVNLLRKHGAIEMYATREDAMRGMVDTWERTLEDNDPTESVMIVHGPNEDVDRVNVLAQERRLKAGHVVGEGVKAPEGNYRIHEGDVVIVAEHAYVAESRGPDGRRERVENGTIGVVVGVDTEAKRVNVSVENPDGSRRRVWFDLGRLREDARTGGTDVAKLRLAYARHVFAVQGATVNVAGELGGHWSQGREGSYVAGSRARYRLHVHVDRESLGLDGNDEDRFRVYATERLGRSQTKLASIALSESRDTKLGMARPSTPEVPNVLEGRAARQRAGDPLARHRIALGDYAHLLDRRAAERAGEAARLPLGELRRECAEAGRALATLNRDDALATGRVRSARRKVEERVQAAEDYATRLRGDADALDAPWQAAERREKLQEARVQDGIAAKDETERATLLAEEAKLREDGRHLGDWLRENGEAVAWWVATQRELGARREAAVERSARVPAASARAELGPVPEESSAERVEWASLVLEYERERIEAGLPEVEIPAQRRGSGLPTFEQRLETWRRHRGLESLAPGAGVGAGAER